MTRDTDVTGLLRAWSDGDRRAHSRLMDIVYGELKQPAKAYLRRELPNRSVAPTALVHEAYLKLVDQRRVRWQNPAPFLRHRRAGDAAHPRRSGASTEGGQAGRWGSERRTR